MNLFTATLRTIRRVLGGERREWRAEMQKQREASIREVKRLRGEPTGFYLSDAMVADRRKRKA